MPRLSPTATHWLDAIDTRWPNARRRAGPIALTVVLEIILLLALLSLGAIGGQDREAGPVITTFDAASETAAEADEPDQPAAAPAAAPAKAAQVTPPTQPAAVATPVPIALPRPATAPPVAPPAPPAQAPPTSTPPRIGAVVRSDMAGSRGPADTGSRGGDSQRIAGSGPNGEPLYAAQWYREPSDDEFRGYFSRTMGSGWALINCRTVPDFRVDDCVLVDEWPDRGGMGSAVLAMAWQFRVRPPRVGGRVMVGEWVRIRIEYTVRRE